MKSTRPAPKAKYCDGGMSRQDSGLTRMDIPTSTATGTKMRSKFQPLNLNIRSDETGLVILESTMRRLWRRRFRTMYCKSHCHQHLTLELVIRRQIPLLFVGHAE